jgi:hypothetical protein
LCPPYLRDEDGNIVKDENGNNMRQPTEVWVRCPIVPTNSSKAPPKTTSSTVSLGLAIGGIAFLLFLLVVLIVIKKRRQ